MDIPHTKNEILNQLPQRFKSLLLKVEFSKLQEIRFRCGKPIILQTDRDSVMLTETGNLTLCAERAVKVKAEDIMMLLSAFCENSVYAYQREICDGFLTIRGGHRVGICGRCVITDGEISNITEISGLNLRIAKQFLGCANSVLPRILNNDGVVSNTILLAPPQCGKTTFLRDLARIISARSKVTIVDERSEIAAVRGGYPQFDIGIQTDVMDRFPKAQGMLCAIRGMSPEVIITDELGGTEDIIAVKSVLNAGCRIITSMHGSNPAELTGERRELFSLFDYAVILSRRQGYPQVEDIIKINKKTVDFCREAEK